MIKKNSVENSCMKVSPAAAYLGISQNSLRKYTDLGLLKAKRLPGGDRLYRREWLDEFVENLPDALEQHDGQTYTGAIRPVPESPREGGE